jgi:hypothetical protein
MSTRTLPLDDDDAPPARTTDHLYLVLDTARPGRAARYALAGATEVVIGRGTPAGVRREGSALRVDCDDRWMSSVHARLVPERGHWTVIDPGSRNGVAVNGVRQPRATNLDGDVVEAGRTVFVLGEGEPAAEPALELVVTPAERGGLVTLDPALAARFGELARIAASAVPVVIGGPTGSGKERVARAVHAGSGRKGAFVPVNCAALPAGLLESELFGHKKGAFSGAVDHHTGLVAAADGGTLFLDEIADLAPAAQAALLRVLEEKEVRAVGATASFRRSRGAASISASCSARSFHPARRSPRPPRARCSSTRGRATRASSSACSSARSRWPARRPSSRPRTFRMRSPPPRRGPPCARATTTVGRPSSSRCSRSTRGTSATSPPSSAACGRRCSAG